MTGGMGRTDILPNGPRTRPGCRQEQLSRVGCENSAARAGPSWIDCSEAGAIRDEMPVAALRVLGVVGLNFPHVLAEGAPSKRRAIWIGCGCETLTRGSRSCGEQGIAPLNR